MLYCHDIMICCNLRTFWKTMDKRKALLGQKQCFLGKIVPYDMVHIAYYTELNLQICNYAQKRCICREMGKYIFALA